MWRILVLSQSHDMSVGISAHQMFSMVRGSRAMSGTKLMPNWALANAHLGTIKVNTQFGNLTPNLVAHQLVHHLHGFLSFPSISSTSTAIHSPLSA